MKRTLMRQPGGRRPFLLERLILGGACLMVAMVTACRSVPEAGVKSFSAASSTLTVTVTSVGSKAVQDVAQIHDGSAESKAKAEQLAADLKKEWAKRVKLMDGVGRYSASLSSLVASGKAGKENAKAFVDSISALANSVGAAIPASPAVTAALALAERSYGEIADYLAANQIQKAVDKADPIINSLSGLISEDLLALRNIAIESRRTALIQLRAGSDFPAMLNSLQSSRSTLAARALRPDNPDPGALGQLGKLNEAFANLTNDPNYLEYHNREVEIERLFRLQADLLDQASATVLAWGAAHHELLIALQQKRIPSLDQLTTFANDLYDIYKNYRTARSQS